MTDEEFVAARNGLYQTEPMRLQQEANNYTRQLEHERKRLLIATDNEKNMQEQLAEIKSSIDDKINENQAATDSEADKRREADRKNDPNYWERLYPTPKKVKTEEQEKAYLKSLQHKLEHEKVLLNNIRGENKDLRVRITSMRHEIIFAKQSITSMEEAIDKLKSQSATANEEGFRYGRQASETNNQILALKCKHEEGKEEFEKNIGDLQEQLKAKDQKVEFNDKSLSRTMEAKQGQGAKQEFANPIEILQIRVNSTVNKNIEKKRLLDQYVRNAKIIQEAFETIMEATGINNIDEIVTSFIKAEEQNVQLFNYVDQLNQENDQLEESNRLYDEQIALNQQMSQLNDNSLANRCDEMQDNNQNLRERIVSLTAEINDQEQEFQELQLLCKDLVLDFKEANFYPKVASQQAYDEHTSFTEGNITQYLGELEEYIAQLITYNAMKNGDPNASTSSVPFAMLSNKDWLAKDMQIDPAYDVQVMGAPDGEPEEEDTIDTKVLYERFLDKVDKNQIQVIRKGDLRGQQNRDD